MLGSVFGFVKEIIGPVADTIDNLTTTKEEKLELKAKLQQIENELTAKYVELEAKTVDAKRDIMVEELKQDDKYTKRARPTIIYAGLAILALNHVLLPWTAYFMPNMAVPTIDLPTEFWLAWGGVSGVYAFGRTQEKKLVSNAMKNGGGK